MSWTTAIFALVLASVALLFLDRCGPPPPPVGGDDGAASIFGSPTSSAAFAR